MYLLISGAILFSIKAKYLLQQNLLLESVVNCARKREVTGLFAEARARRSAPMYLMAGVRPP